jgi:hypothetical protein
MVRFDRGCGRGFAAGIGGEAEVIERKVMRRLSPGIRPEMIKMADCDVFEGLGRAGDGSCHCWRLWNLVK